jgi:hypothetical protein
MAPEAIRVYAIPLLGVGLVVHAAGMTLKYRLEGRESSPLWWERSLFWLCWIFLAALGLWMATALATR